MIRLPTVSQLKRQINDISQQFEQIQRLQAQVTTGKKIQQSSEDPLLANKVKAIGDFMQTIKGYELNGTLAQSRASLFNASSQESLNILMRVQELVQSAQNDTMNASDRNTIAQELKGYVDNLARIANTQDNNGEYIFSGINSNTPAYTKTANRYVYQGSQEATYIAISAGHTVPYNESGLRIFGNLKTGNGVFSLSSDGVNNTGTGIASSINSQTNSGFVPDEYTLSFVTNSAGNLAYQVSGTHSGQLIPALPLLAPDDAPTFIAGSEIRFNGVAIEINGQPAVGDNFYVTPAKTQNIFDALSAMITTLNTPVPSEKEKANFHQTLSEQSSSFNQALGLFQQYLTEVGNRGKTIDDQITVNSNVLIDNQILSGKLSDADLGQVISDLTQRLTALEITQQSYLKIQESYSHFMQQ